MAESTPMEVDAQKRQRALLAHPPFVVTTWDAIGLLPCPFCGRLENLYGDSRYNTWGSVYFAWVVCAACCLAGPRAEADTMVLAQARAMKAWQRRPELGGMVNA